MEKDSSATEKKKRVDIKVDPAVKHALQMEAARLDVFDYELAEEAINRHLVATKTLPNLHRKATLGPEQIAVLDALPGMFDDASASEVVGLISRMVHEWKSRKLQPHHFAVAENLKAKKAIGVPKG